MVSRILSSMTGHYNFLSYIYIYINGYKWQNTRINVLQTPLPIFIKSKTIFSLEILSTLLFKN